MLKKIKELVPGEVIEINGRKIKVLSALTQKTKVVREVDTTVLTYQAENGMLKGAVWDEFLHGDLEVEVKEKGRSIFKAIASLFKTNKPETTGWSSHPIGLPAR